MRIQSHMESAVLQVAAALPRSAQRLVAGPARQVDGLTLDPEVQLTLRLMRLSPQAAFETLPVPMAREVILHEARLVAGPTIELPEVRDLTIPSGKDRIAARLYLPGSGRSTQEVTSGTTGGLLIYFHGGGWVLGDLDSHDNTCRFLAKHARTAVLAVDYRRAPEHPFPAAVDDAMTALRYATEHAEQIGVRANAIAVGGDSAGGNLAAVVSQLATAAGAPPAFQLLVYPVTDLSAKSRSYRLFASGYFLTEAQMDWYRDHYLPGADTELDPRASPLLAQDLRGLPPAYVATAGFDPLRDEGERYAQRLAEAGVAVIARRHAGLVHGFINAVGVGRVGRKAAGEAAVALRAALTLAGR